MDEKLLLLFLTVVAVTFSILLAWILTKLLRKIIEVRLGDFSGVGAPGETYVNETVFERKVSREHFVNFCLHSGDMQRRRGRIGRGQCPKLKDVLEADRREYIILCSLEKCQYKQ